MRRNNTHTYTDNKQVFVEVSIDDIVEELRPILDLSPQKGFILQRRYIDFVTVPSIDEYIQQTNRHSLSKRGMITTIYESKKTPFIYSVTRTVKYDDSVPTIMCEEGTQIIFKNSKEHKIFHIDANSWTEDLFVFTHYDSKNEEDVEYRVTFPKDNHTFFMDSLNEERMRVLWGIIIPNIDKLYEYI